MLCEKMKAVKRMLAMQPIQVQFEVGKFFEKMIALFPHDKIHGPRKTHLFAFAVLSETTGKENQYVSVTAADHCTANHRVKHGKFRIQVMTKDGKPGPDWGHCLRWDKGDGVECWENEPKGQNISKEITEYVSKARNSVAKWH